jgi:hypothetical protein
MGSDEETVTMDGPGKVEPNIKKVGLKVNLNNLN